ncbi:hypothetical protein llap_22887 [Limosa lapponica baueri]|uniref:Uncharacterized protein n=1 Tax=Limosa lapponica baueri TaxID=1758121 RepID=A0A2I0SZ46_LIMLA|nr:hypothetical protein llap_22887 [Limosa lapponica baueri]
MKTPSGRTTLSARSRSAASRSRPSRGALTAGSAWPPWTPTRRCRVRSTWSCGSPSRATRGCCGVTSSRPGLILPSPCPAWGQQ